MFDIANLSLIEESKLSLGIAFLLYTTFGRIVFKGTHNLEKMPWVNHPVFRYLIVFATAFVATQDLKISGILLVSYFILFDVLLKSSNNVAKIEPRKK